MKFDVNDSLLRSMFKLGSFTVPQDELVFFVLRGCQPIAFGGSPFAAAHPLQTVPIDYRHMRCTIGQWHTASGKLAVFVGSSVPHIAAVAAKAAANGNGVNRLASGFFGHVPGLTNHRYYKGNHGKDRHLAFRNDTKLPVWRTGDDADYEGDDRFEFETVYDNLHCAHQMNETASTYSSHGCIVVAGKAGNSGAASLTSELGPWKSFLTNAYKLDQFSFSLALFEENEAMRTAELGYGERGPTVRFGSRGLLVARLQQGLIDRGYAIGSPVADGLFGGRTAEALRRFQFDTFGKGGTDLICGAGTAEALGIDWPRSGAALDALLSPLPAPAPAADADPVAAEVAPPPAVAATPLSADPGLKIRLDTGHQPLPGWKIRKQAGTSGWTVEFSGGTPITLGKFFEYTGYAKEVTRGLARTHAHQPRLAFDPAEWTEFGKWPELMYPTAYAESNACFSVINAWDRAAMTLGFAQLAAHTGDDLLPLLRRLIVELADEARQWFPELAVVGGRLCFTKGEAFKSLENRAPARDGGYSADYYRGDLMAFFNPDRYHADLKPDPEELHAAARWLVWSLTSPAMRRIQVDGSINNLKASLARLHGAMLADAAVRRRYPRGVDGMRCDLLSVAIAVPHLSEGKIPVVLSALKGAEPIEAIRKSGYGPGGRAENAHAGMLRRPELRNLVYDLTAGRPV